MIGGAASPYLTFGPADDILGAAALVAGLFALAIACFRRSRLPSAIAATPTRVWVGTWALVAAGLSWLYVHHYLGGGPRIVDATAYYLEARTIAAGGFAFDVPAPSGSFRGRFLLTAPDGRLGVVFPPGYPLALAAGFVAGAPLLVGPVLAALLVVLTHLTVRALTSDERAARCAAFVSALCVTLRYHTADTMSHGFSAVLFLATLACAAREHPGWLLAAGLWAGWLVATRPFTGMAAGAVALFLLHRRPAGIPLLAAGMLPGVALLALHQRVLTGSFFASVQLRYYALADGPPGCFHWGFGDQVGCRFEHGDFVRASIPDGFGPLDAARNTLDRLALHSVDVANLAPLALLALWAVIRLRRERGVPALTLGTLLTMAAYAPFYFPGSYPGGGARFFADVLPLEHGLVALAATRLGIARFLPAAMLLGFALHDVHSHRSLSQREGGKPMFVADALESVKSGLVLIATDHGFMLGHDPSERDPRRGLVVARERGDAHDRILWERLGKPPLHRYEYDLVQGTTRVARVHLEPNDLRFEAEAEWPPLAIRGGWAHPEFAECLSRGQGLRLRATSEETVASIELVPGHRGRYTVRLGWLADPRATLAIRAGRSMLSVDGGAGVGAGCFSATAGELELDERTIVELASAHDVVVDYVSLTPVDTKKR